MIVFTAMFLSVYCSMIQHTKYIANIKIIYYLNIICRHMKQHNHAFRFLKVLGDKIIIIEMFIIIIIIIIFFLHKSFRVSEPAQSNH